MALAVLAAREQSRDWTLPPRDEVVWLGVRHRPLGCQFDSTADASDWLTERLAAGDVVVASGLDLLFACWLYRRPAAALIPVLTDALLAGQLVSLEDVAAAIAALQQTEQTAERPGIREYRQRARQIMAWVEANRASAFWSSSRIELNKWLTRQTPTPAVPVQPGTAGILGTAPSVLSRAIGLTMSWHGLAVDDVHLESLLAEHAQDKAATDRLIDLRASVREDDRCHPWHYIQMYMRLGARWPAYQALSWRRKPDERAAVTASRGYNLQGIDVAQAEMFTTGLCWQYLFGDRRLVDQLAAGADVHAFTGNRLVADHLVPRMTPHQQLRQLGKALNLAFANLASTNEVAGIIATHTTSTPAIQDISRLMTTVGHEHPIREWTELCTRIAFHSSNGPTGLVPTLTGRWIRVRATQNKQKPAPSAVASAMTQSVFADMHAMGMVELVRAMGRSVTSGGRLVGSVADELLVEMPKGGVLDERAYLAGTQRILGTQGLTASVRQFGSHWSG